MIEKYPQEYLRKIVTPDFCKFFQGQRILITGASGLIGTHFTLLFQMFNQFFQGKTDLSIISKTSEFPFELKGAIKVIKQDLTEVNVSKMLGKFDSIIHCAGYGQPTKFQSERLKTIHLNTTSTIELSKLVADKGSFLFMSTSEVYSGLDNPPFREEQIGITNTNHPRSSYIESKRTGEAIIAALRVEFPEMIASSARLALAYGPGVKAGDSRVINQLINQGLTKKEIILRDSGSAKRTYCFAPDAIEQCIAILMHGKDHVYNVGGVSQVTIANLAGKIGEILKVSVKIPEFQEKFLLDAPLEVGLDLTKIEELSGKKDYVDINSGLEETILWMKHNLNKAKV